MKTTGILLFIILFLSACGSTSMKKEVNIEKDLNSLPAISGYDPVSYFTIKKPKRGNGHNNYTYMGQTYLFSSVKNMKRFKKNPEKYIPQFGGWCAYGISVNKKFHTNPHAWELVDGKLYLNLDKKVQKIWRKNKAKNIQKAHENWPVIKSKPAKEL